MSLATIEKNGHQAVVMPAQEPTALAPTKFTFDELERIAEAAAKSGLFPGIANKQAALALMLLCDADGLHPMDAVRRYHIIEGRPSMRADTMQAEFQRRGGYIEWHQYDNEVADATLYHPKHAPKGLRLTITMKDLTARGLATTWKDGKVIPKKNYKNSPASMLRARLITEGVRMVDPSVVVGIYTPEEVEDFAGEERKRLPTTTAARLLSRLAPPTDETMETEEIQEAVEIPPFRDAFMGEVAAANERATTAGASVEFGEWHAMNSLANYLVGRGKIIETDIETDGKRDNAKTRAAIVSIYHEKPKPLLASLRAALDVSIAKAQEESQETTVDPEDESQEAPEPGSGG